MIGRGFKTNVANAALANGTMGYAADVEGAGIARQHISAVLGHPVAVRCVATNIDVLPELPADAEAAWILAEARRIFEADGADAKEVG